jgi:hypothetical protein
MKRSLLFFGFAILLALGVGTAAQAQATRTWISGVGDDANPCSRTAPCKTFAGAISKTAAGGEIDALDPGGFGGVTITKSITLDGGAGQVASILVAGTNGITVNALSTDVVIIRNLRIMGLANTGSPGLSGVNVMNAFDVDLENDVFEGFGSAGSPGSFGVKFQPASRGNLTVSNCTFDDNLQGGLAISTTATTGGKNRAIVTNSRFYNNSTGVGAGGFGVDVGANSTVSISNSQMFHNGDGVLVENSGLVSVTNSDLSNNLGNGLHATTSGIATISSTLFSSNRASGLLFDNGGQILSFGNNYLYGNSPDGAPSGPAALH